MSFEKRRKKSSNIMCCLCGLSFVACSAPSRKFTNPVDPKVMREREELAHYLPVVSDPTPQPTPSPTSEPQGTPMPSMVQEAME